MKLTTLRFDVDGVFATIGEIREEGASAVSRRNAPLDGCSGAFAPLSIPDTNDNKNESDMRHNDREMRLPSGTVRRAVLALTSFCASIMVLTQPVLADVANPLLPRNLSPWGMFLNADIVVKVVMIGLALASLVTWTVWLAKTVELRGAKRLARRRLKMIENGSNLVEAVRACDGKRDAVAQLILSTAREAELSDDYFDDGFKERVALRLQRVEAAMTRQVSRGVGILATIGATAPFVGLFGTVWGIMNSFIGISESHTTNLAVVAPGIAEALLATAFGLVAAIPAVVIYNHLARVIGGYRTLLGDASAQLLLMVSRGQSHRVATLPRAAE
jgi:biopolymer transport protein ExbB